MYIQDLDSNVYAVALATGKLVWECHLDKPIQSGPGPNGVAVADGKVYGTTPTTAFALNAATGRSIWVDSDLLSRDQGTFGIQPAVANGRVYLASQHGAVPGGGPLMALDAATGKLLWKFNSVVGGNAGVSAVGAGSGGAWETPLVSGDGSVTFGVGNPYLSVASAIAHPSAAALQRQRREPRRRHRQAPLVLPGRAERLPGSRHADVTDLGEQQRSPDRHRVGQGGLSCTR